MPGVLEAPPVILNDRPLIPCSGSPLILSHIKICLYLVIFINCVYLVHYNYFSSFNFEMNITC